MRRIGALGLAVHVSELDGITSTFPGTREQKLDRQAQAFQTVASACQAVDACFRITLWGAADHWSWRGTGEMAVALDDSYAEKPGWAGIQEAIRPQAPLGQPPSAPGQPAASAAPNAGVFTVSWPASWDPEGDRVSYVLEHRDADDAAWSPVGERHPRPRLLVRRRPARAPGHLPLPRARLRRARGRRLVGGARRRGRGPHRPGAARDHAGPRARRRRLVPRHRDALVRRRGRPGAARRQRGLGRRPGDRARRRRRSPPPARTRSRGSCATARATRRAAPRRPCRSTRRRRRPRSRARRRCEAGEAASATWSASDAGSGLAGPATRVAAARHDARRDVHRPLRGRRRRRPPHARDLPVRRGGRSPSPTQSRPPRRRPRRRHADRRADGRPTDAPRPTETPDGPAAAAARARRRTAGRPGRRRRAA